MGLAKARLVGVGALTTLRSDFGAGAERSTFLDVPADLAAGLSCCLLFFFNIKFNL